MGEKLRLLWLVLILGLLAGCGVPAEAHTATNRTTQPLRKPTAGLKFPYSLPESGLIVEKLQSYSGPYWEDGSGEHVENIAGLMVFNPTDRLVEFAAFAAEQEGETLYFFVYALPPQSRCLALEYTKKTENAEIITSCRQLCVRWDRQELSREQIDYLGLGTSMTIINRDGRQLDCVTVRYKQYEKDGDYYLGGAVQTVRLFSLHPEERRTVWPGHYDAAHARIVEIKLDI